MQQGMWLFCLRYRTWHFPLSNCSGFLSANYSSVSRSLCMAAQPSAISNTFQLGHLYSKKTKQESHSVLNTTMWLSLLMTPTLWSNSTNLPSELERLFLKVNNVDIFPFIHRISVVTGHFEATSALNKSGTCLSDAQLHTVDPTAALQDHLSFT